MEDLYSEGGEATAQVVRGSYGWPIPGDAVRKASGSVPGEKPNVDLAHGLILSQVLESCMKSCGKRFHDEVGKFRFLNELIKVVSPKVGPWGSSWR